jgi:CspA family cold shock protein
MSINGKVKWFDGRKGYGFIEREDKEKDVFVHASAAEAASLQLNEGDALTFEVESGDKGPSAVNLQKA